MITVLLEDYLKDRIRRAGAWLRRIRAHGPLPIATEAFTLGPLRTPTVIVEGDGEQIIDQQSIHVLVDAGQVELPEEMRAWVEEIQQEQDRKRQPGRRISGTGRCTRSPDSRSAGRRSTNAPRSTCI
ncbi:MAG TPA: hypothetical protein VGJ45_19450 [Pseudonocardiaceae bacterium]